MTKKNAKKTNAFVHELETAYKLIPDTNRRAAEALRAVLEATVLASQVLDEDESLALHELDALKSEAETCLKRLQRWRKSHPRPEPEPELEAAPAPARKKTDERAHFLQVLRHSLSSWRLPPPSARKHPPTLRDIAVQLARTLEREHGRKIAEDAGVIPPPTSDIADRILTEWTKHIESHGEYQLGDAGSERMIVDAFRGFGLPRRAAEALYDFAHPKKRHHA